MAFASAAASAARAVDTSARAWRIRSGREPARRSASRSRAASRRLTAVATASLALSTACWLIAWPPTRARARSRSRAVRATSDSAPDSSASAAATSSGRAPRSRSRRAASAAASRARWPSSVAASVACVRMASVSPGLHASPSSTGTRSSRAVAIGLTSVSMTSMVPWAMMLVDGCRLHAASTHDGECDDVPAHQEALFREGTGSRRERAQ